MDTKVSLIYGPGEEELRLLKRCAWVTEGITIEPKKPASPELLWKLLRARHSPIRVLNFAFLLEGIPSNTATHFARHVHAVPFVSTLRNDRQDLIDGDLAPRNTPVDMILFCNAEELMIIANKRLCGKAAPNTRRVAQMICDAAIESMPVLETFLVPMCKYLGGRCPEVEPCGYR